MLKEEVAKIEPAIYMIERRGKFEKLNEEMKVDKLLSSEKRNTMKTKDDGKIFTSRAIQTEHLNASSLASSQSLNSSFLPSNMSEKSLRHSSIDMTKEKKITDKKYKDLNDMGTIEKDRIRVIVRVRPLNSNELQTDNVEIVTCQQQSLIINGKSQARKFLFDAVFDQSASQEDIFEFSGVKRLVNMAIDGYVCTCFAYGQTGSGKTFTMAGPAGSYNMRKGEKFIQFGLIPRSINYLFNRLREITLVSNSVFYIRVSYYEIYNEQIRDLINPHGSAKLELRGNQEEGFYVENLFSTYIETMDEILTILEEGELNRASATHLLNEHSSRSHAILTIQIENEITNNGEEQETRLGKLIFVDLAGSERAKITRSKGKQLVEANNINKSLLVLGTCISALSDPNKKDGHIPYRDSKLTKLLSDSLGGSGITLMIATISPSNTCENETLNTLRYASRAQNIENIPLIKTDSRDNVIQKLKRELRKLKNENQTLKQQVGGASPLPVSNSATKLPRITRYGSSNSTASNDSEIFEKLKEYMAENKSLKNENNALTKLREKIRKQHELLSKENEKLARKLDQLLREQGKPSLTEYVVVDDINLPKIESTPTKYVLPTSNVSTIKTAKIYPQVIETYADDTELVRPTYLKKFKQRKDFQTKYDSDTNLKRVTKLPDTILETDSI